MQISEQVFQSVIEMIEFYRRVLSQLHLAFTNVTVSIEDVICTSNLLEIWERGRDREKQSLTAQGI